MAVLRRKHENDIYISTKDSNKYLSVPAGIDVTKFNFSDDIDPDVLDLTPFKLDLELDLSKPRFGLNQDDIHQQITAKGYALHGAAAQSTISLTGSI